MYRRISHNILEEHFDTPQPPPKSRDDTIRPGNGSLGPDSPLPSYVMNESTMLFRMDSRTAWTKWAFSLMNYAISLNGNLPGTDEVKGRMHKNSILIGDFLIPYYGLTAANAMSTALIAIDDIGMHYVEALKAKKPTDDIVASWKSYIDDIARLMNELNPNNWPITLIRDIFTNIVGAWQAQLKARAEGNIIANEIAIDQLTKIAVTGVPDHNKKGFSSMADIFSRGIIAQFPTLFAD